MNQFTIDAHKFDLYAHNFTSRKRGVTILFPKNLDFKIKGEPIVDSEGRILILKGTIDKIEYMFIKYYAPTIDQKKVQLESLANLMQIVE